eukprot:GEMP01040125.1.p1 GENE.GEMP01040125.1~~GEMP01040125.1.p1  ORF type:complete len:218 (+),score=29.61 GEMP01040125.1:158-811(+)
MVDLENDSASRSIGTSWGNAIPFVKVAAKGGLDKVSTVLDNFELYVQQGPDGVRFLSFLGGILVTVYGIACAISVLDIFSNPVGYIVGSSQVLFGFVTVVLEASPSIIASYSTVESLQRTFNDYAKFLTLLWGRGFFYVYIGSHIIYLSGIFSLGGALGLYMCLMGIFYLAWYMGYDVSKATGYMIEGIRSCVFKVRSRLGRGSSEASDNSYVRIEE